MIALQTKAEEGGTYTIENIQLFDSSDPPENVTPKTDLQWSLCREDGTTIDTESVTKALSMDITLSGDQLLISESELATADYNMVLGKKVYFVNRSLSVRTTIDTDKGTDLPVTQEFIFIIDNITCIT